MFISMENLKSPYVKTSRDQIYHLTNHTCKQRPYPSGELVPLIFSLQAPHVSNTSLPLKDISCLGVPFSTIPGTF